MKPRTFFLRWLLTSLGVFVATQIVPGIECRSFGGLLVTALVLGLLNAFVRPLLFVVSFPLVVLSFGLFLWIINAGLLYFAGWLVKPFVVASFGSALGGSAVIGLVSMIGSAVLGVPRSETGPGRGPTGASGRRGPGDSGGPVIDV